MVLDEAFGRVHREPVHLIVDGQAVATVVVRFRRGEDGTGRNDEPVTFADVPAGTATHVKVQGKLYPLGS